MELPVSAAELSNISFPCELILVQYIEYNEEEGENWVMEFLIPIELKEKLFKMMEIVENTIDCETYVIDYEILVLPTSDYYNGFIYAKMKNLINLTDWKDGYKFIGYISDWLPHERKLLEEINKQFNKNFSNIMEISDPSLNTEDDDDDDVDSDDKQVSYECIDLDDLFGKQFTDPKF